MRYVRVTILSTQGPSSFRDLSEFGVYSARAGRDPDAHADPDAHPDPDPATGHRPDADRDRPADRDPDGATARGDAAPPSPVAKPAVHARGLGQTRAQGARDAAPSRCAVRAELKVDAKTAKRLGSTRTVGTFRRTLGSGTTTFTVNLSSKVKRALLRKVTSFKATLTVSSGTVTTTKKVTVRR